MSWLTKIDWRGNFIFLAIVIGVITAGKLVIQWIKSKFGVQFKGAHLDVEMQPLPVNSNQVILKLVEEFKALLTQSSDEQKQERAVLIKGLSAALEWISKQPGANGKIEAARGKLEDWLIQRGLQ